MTHFITLTACSLIQHSFSTQAYVTQIWRDDVTSLTRQVNIFDTAHPSSKNTVQFMILASVTLDVPYTVRSVKLLLLFPVTCGTTASTSPVVIDSCQTQETSVRFYTAANYIEKSSLRLVLTQL